MARLPEVQSDLDDTTENVSFGLENFPSAHKSHGLSPFEIAAH
jgi:hypothetical protein